MVSVFVCRVPCLLLRCIVTEGLKNKEKRKGRWCGAKTKDSNFDRVLLGAQVWMLYVTSCNFFAGDFHIVSEGLLNIQ